MVFVSPAFNVVVGFHPSLDLAFEMSGHLRTGSSSGSLLWTIADVEFVMAHIRVAMSLIVCSSGLPRLIGPISSPFINNISPVTISSQ